MWRTADTWTEWWSWEKCEAVSSGSFVNVLMKVWRFRASNAANTVTSAGFYNSQQLDVVLFTPDKRPTNICQHLALYSSGKWYNQLSFKSDDCCCVHSPFRVWRCDTRWSWWHWCVVFRSVGVAFERETEEKDVCKVTTVTASMLPFYCSLCSFMMLNTQ